MKIWKKLLQVDRVHLKFIAERKSLQTSKQTNKQTYIHTYSTYIHTHYAYAIAFHKQNLGKILSSLTNQHSVVLPSMLLTFETRPSLLRNLQMAYSKAKLTVFRS